MNLNTATMKFTGMDIVLRPKDVVATSVVKKLGEVYEEYANKVFLFDCSGSMSESLSHNQTDKFLWAPELLAAIKIRLGAVMAKVAALEADVLGIEPPLSADEYEILAMVEYDYTTGKRELPVDDAELKMRVIRHNLIAMFGVPVNFEKHGKKPLSRMDVVKKLANREIKARLDKFPNSRVSVIAFNSGQEVLFDAGKPEDLWRAIELLQPAGGTDILSAIERGLDVCRKHPSKVGVHHFIIVSDGEDWGSSNRIGEWLPALKASGVIMDYIHIGDLKSNTGLAAACKELGGDFVTVTDEEELEARFVEAVSRMCLPAPAEAK